jgi:hypothetical protein
MPIPSEIIHLFDVFKILTDDQPLLYYRFSSLKSQGFQIQLVTLVALAQTEKEKNEFLPYSVHATVTSLDDVLLSSYRIPSICEPCNYSRVPIQNIARVEA